MFKVGDIVRHDYRKTNVYLVGGFDRGKAVLFGVEKRTGYPLKKQKSVFQESHMDRMWLADHANEYDGMTLDQIRSKHRDLLFKDFVDAEGYVGNRPREGFPVAGESDFLGMEEKIRDEFLELACGLSPENLTCDGELPRLEVARRRAEIVRRWKALEDIVGSIVLENIVWRVSR